MCVYLKSCSAWFWCHLTEKQEPVVTKVLTTFFFFFFLKIKRSIPNGNVFLLEDFAVLRYEISTFLTPLNRFGHHQNMCCLDPTHTV